MEQLVNNCKNHNYVWLKRDSVPVTEPQLKIYDKDIYVCVDCGQSVDIYDINNPIIFGDKS